jgi:hypothetical protein
MLSLVVLAAGRSTRFGTSKQTSVVGPAGEWLLDYALFDARRAGFTAAVIVVRPGAEAAFDALRARVPVDFTVRVVPQRTGLLPAAREEAPRAAPWGTAHAVLAARRAVEGLPFAVVNADDYYGPRAYELAGAAVRRAGEDGVATLIAMRLGQTLSQHGPVTRAVCRLRDSRVVGLEEIRGIERHAGRIVSATGLDMDADVLVSMNGWALPQRVMTRLAARFVTFAAEPGAHEREFLLPAAVAELIASGQLVVEAAEAPGPWFGLTHAGDRPAVVENLRRLTDEGVYPSPLWRPT